jgi:hypothetical protein
MRVLPAPASDFFFGASGWSGGDLGNDCAGLTATPMPTSPNRRGFARTLARVLPRVLADISYEAGFRRGGDAYKGKAALPIS